MKLDQTQDMPAAAPGRITPNGRNWTRIRKLLPGLLW